MRIKVYFITVVLLLTLLVGCAPPEQAAILEPTKPPPTATTAPTPTATPIPIDAILSVTDSEGQPLAGAKVMMGSENFTLDESGQLSLANLPSESLSLQVQMPGYFPIEYSATLSRGSNAVDLVLERDPEGLLAEHACGPGETLLYIADFQDGAAHGWDLVELGTPGWRIGTNPDSPDDLVLEATNGAGFANLSDPITQGVENVVWRFRFRYEGTGHSHINFRFAPEGGDRRYIVALGNNSARLDRLLGSHVNIAEAGEFTSDEWHLLEVSYFDGTVTVYLDGNEGVTWVDPNPWPGGGLSLEPYPDPGSTYYYDDMSLCALSSPFTTIPRPATGINLAVSVVDENGAPLPMVNGFIPQLGSYAGAAQSSDADGKMIWADLPAEPMRLVLSAPGYMGLEEALDLHLGENTHTFTLARDPNGLTIDQACLPGETLLYIDDFQDGLAQDWSGIDLGAEGWSVTADPDNPGDLVIAATQGVRWADLTSTPADGFNNVIWRFWLRYDGTGSSHLNFRLTQQGGDTRYIVNVTNYQANLDRLADNNHVTLRTVGFTRNRTWHLLEIGYFGNEVFVFLDGALKVTYQETNPWTGGTVNLEPNPAAGSVFYYNNISVCGLSAAPQSITTLAADN